ncbi:hypothetical protein BH11VER1_BH11VER1_17700 [soil metagenome]
MNTEQTDHLINQLKQRAEEIVKRGSDVRAEVSRLVSDSTSKFYETRDGLTQMVKAVTEGAVEAAKDSLPDKSESVLRSVVDGLSDGLTKSVQSVRLTLEESNASSVHFAKDDLDKIAKDFRAVGEVFGSIVSDATGKVGGHVAQQGHTISEHAKQALKNVWPSLESAITAALHNPVKLGRESLHAGTAAAQQATGVLFSELGKRLQATGDKLRH